MRYVWGLVRAVIWLLAAALIAVGAAGIAAGANPVPDEIHRPELFSRAGARVGARLAVIDAQLLDIQGQVGELSALSRTALVSLNGGDHEGLVAALDAGDVLVVEIGGQATAVAGDLRALPYRPDDWRLSAAMGARIAAANDAVEAVRPLADLWNRVARGALPASALAGHLADHDRIAFAATRQGTAGRYGDALELLADARLELDEAIAIRDQVAESVDTTTLDLWVERNRTYDDALVRLYEALRAADGRVTDAARRAFADVERAEGRLPPDTRGIVVIMADLAQGGLNQAAIRIDEARGALAAAAAAVD
jgi:hypothetical protein